MKKIMVASCVACVLGFGGMPATAQDGWMPMPQNYWQHLLHLGENIKLDSAPNAGINIDQLTEIGGEADAMPHPGMTVTLGGKALKWTELRNAPDDAAGNAVRWNPETADLVRYWHIYIFAPGDEERDARIVCQHDDDIKIWLNGAMSASWNGYNYNDMFSEIVTLKPGVNRVLVKLREGGPANMMAVGVRMDDTVSYFTDLLYRLDFSMLAGAPGIVSLTQTNAVISAELANRTGFDADVFVGVAAEDLGASMDDWNANGRLIYFGSIPDGATKITAAIAQLADETPYAARVFATNDFLSAASGALLFETYSARPAIESKAAVGIDSTTYSAMAELVYTGAEAEANVFLHWGEADGGTNAWQTTVDLGMKSAGEISSTLSGLQLGTPYHYRHSASNAAGIAWAPASAGFTTPGLPVFNAPRSAVFSDAAKISVELARAGAMAADVSLLFGESPAAMTAVRAWHGVAEPAEFAFMTNSLAPGAVYSYAFEAACALPANPGAAIIVSTATNTFVVGNRSLVWDNKINLNWNTADKNWHIDGAETGGSLFAQGDSAQFRTGGNLDVTLTENIAAERVEIALGGGHAMRMLAPMGGGGAELFVLDELAAVPASGISSGTLHIEEPRLGGAARIFVNRQTVNLGNPANDFNGGALVGQGALNGVMSEPAGTLFGSGDIAVGADAPAAAASIGFSRKASGAELFANTSAGALVAAGAFNSGRLVLADAGGGVSARFGSIAQKPGASLTLHKSGADASLFLDAPFSGAFPPWFVIAGGGGSYAAHDAGNGVVAAAADTSDITASSPSDIASLSGELAAGGSAAAAVVDGWLRLEGNTIALGNNGAAGLLLKENIDNSADGGGFDADGCDLFVYAESSRYISANVNAESIRKFGGGRLILRAARQYPNLIVAQEGALEFTLNADCAYPGRIIAMDELYVPASGGEHAMAFTGKGNVLNVQTLTFSAAADSTNRLDIASGDAMVRGNMYLNSRSFGAVSNAALSIASELRIGNGGDAGLLVSGGGDVSASYVELGSGTGRNELAVRDGGRFAFNSTLRLSGNASSTRNNASFINGAELAGAGTVEVGYLGGLNTLLFDASSGSVNRVNIGAYEASTNNLMSMRNGSSLACADIFYVGGRSSGARFAIEDSILVAKEISLGYEPAGHGNLMEILAGASVTNTADLMIGRLGNNNTLRVGAGGELAVAGALNIGMNSWLKSGGTNMLLLAGGEVCARDLNVVGANALGVELQLQGFGAACGLGELNASAAATFDDGALLRPYYAKGAPGGKFRVLTASGGITDNGLRLDIPPQSANMRWAYKIEGDSLYLQAWQDASLLIVR